jgi:FtsZ-binding cell division protein ZapB
VDSLFWLGFSILLVAVSLTAVLVAAVPAFRELARAARSAEKLFDTLSRELPPTLEAIRLTGMEITDLKEDVSEGVQGAGRVVQQVDQSIDSVKKQAQQAQTTTRSLFAGVKAAWHTFHRPERSARIEDGFEEDESFLTEVEDREVEDREVEDREVEDREVEDREVEDREVEDSASTDSQPKILSSDRSHALETPHLIRPNELDEQSLGEQSLSEQYIRQRSRT